jgi:hypothetical protein
MAAGDVASISGLGSALRLPTETGSGLIGAAFDILRRKVLLAVMHWNMSPSRNSQGGP